MYAFISTNFSLLFVPLRICQYRDSTEASKLLGSFELFSFYVLDINLKKYRESEPLQHGRLYAVTFGVSKG